MSSSTTCFNLLSIDNTNKQQLVLTFKYFKIFFFGLKLQDLLNGRKRFYLMINELKHTSTVPLI